MIGGVRRRPTLRAHPSRSLGKGGEADVYDSGHGRAVKVFKWPDHPTTTDRPEQQRAQKIGSQYTGRSCAFPSGLPPGSLRLMRSPPIDPGAPSSGTR